MALTLKGKNGKEFAEHESITEKKRVFIYFSLSTAPGREDLLSRKMAYNSVAYIRRPVLSNTPKSTDKKQ